jgi:aminopeptidase N
MRKSCLFFSILLVFISLSANCPKKKGKKKYPKLLEEVIITPQNYITSYKASYKIYFDLLSTKLNLRPVFKEKVIYGTAELLLKPHFYDQNQLVLDAKYMKINSVELITASGNKKLNYSYDTMQLKIDLERYYTRNDQIALLIDYVSQPYVQDSLQRESDRGIYFIDVEDKNPYKTHAHVVAE